jgi:hypothetical protein
MGMYAGFRTYLRPTVVYNTVPIVVGHSLSASEYLYMHAPLKRDAPEELVPYS